jgi:hypothetical protein
MGIHLMPWISGGNDYYVSMVPFEGTSPVRANNYQDANGESVTLMSRGFQETTVAKKFGLVFSKIEVARQFSSGLRLGTSFVLYNTIDPRVSKG